MRSSRRDVRACLCLFNDAIQSKWAITLISGGGGGTGRGYLFHLISWLTLSHHFGDEAMGADGRGKGRHFAVKGDQHPRDKNRARTLPRPVALIGCKPRHLWTKWSQNSTSHVLMPPWRPTVGLWPLGILLSLIALLTQKCVTRVKSDLFKEGFR